MKWNFPQIDPVRFWDTQHYLDHVREECWEFEVEQEGTEDKAKECLDILHAAETLVRKYFERNPQFKLEDIQAAIIVKNTSRGYYD